MQRSILGHALYKGSAPCIGGELRALIGIGAHSDPGKRPSLAWRASEVASSACFKLGSLGAEGPKTRSIVSSSSESCPARSSPVPFAERVGDGLVVALERLEGPVGDPLEPSELPSSRANCSRA